LIRIVGKPIVENFKISNLRTGNCVDALVDIDVDLQVCAASVQAAESSCNAADRLACDRHQQTDALIVALRTAVVTQDLSSRAVTSTPSAKCNPRATRYRASGFVL
jgi:hypothetical protein